MKALPVYNNRSYSNPSPLTNKALIAKVVTVTVATFLFFSLQFPVGIALTCRIALAASATTIFSEKVIRPLNSDLKSINWLNRDFNKDKLKKDVNKHFVKIIIINALIFGILIPPIQTAFGFHALGLYNFLQTTVIAPIAEEILFRGVLQERIEDVFILLNAFVITIETETIKTISIVATNVLFGGAHIIGNQVVPWAISFVLYQTTMIGIFLSRLKEKENSLIPSMVIHMTHNTGCFCGLILAKHISSFAKNLF